VTSTSNEQPAEDPLPIQDCSQWIPRCRLQLKGRERNLMESRLLEFVRTVKLSMDQFCDQNTRYFIEWRRRRDVRVPRMDRMNRETMDRFLNKALIDKVSCSYSAAIDHALNNWNGVQRSSKLRNNGFVDYKSYLKPAKNWFDQHKIPLLAELCWTPLLDAVQQIAHNAAALFFHHRFLGLQRRYEEYLHLLIVLNTMRCTVSFSNAGKKLLISPKMLTKIKATSPILQRLWQHDQLQLRSSDAECAPMTNKAVRERMVSSCESMLAVSTREFEETLYALHHEIDHLPATPLVGGLIEVSAPEIPSSGYGHHRGSACKVANFQYRPY